MSEEDGSVIEAPLVRVYAYRHRDETYTVENADVFPFEPITILAGRGLSIFVRADTAVGAKWVAVRTERDPEIDGLSDRLVSKLAYPLVKAEIPHLSGAEIERLVTSGEVATLDAHSDRVRARREQYANEIAPRLIEAAATA